MQIKPPRLEAASGTEDELLKDTYRITTEGKDSIDVSFTIVIPSEMLSEQWTISLTPSVSSRLENGILRDVVIKGWKFADEQENSYSEYHDFVNSIIDSSKYEETYIDQKRLEKEIEERHDEYWQYYYTEWERQVEYEMWKSKQAGSIQTYSSKNRTDYREQLYKQYLIRIQNQSSRYLKAKMDTAGLHNKYMTEFEIHDKKMPRFFVDEYISIKNVPKKFIDLYESKRTLDDITDAMLDLLVRRDSALMSLPVLDYGRIIENERKSILQDGIFNDMVQLPKNEKALHDTTIYDLRSDYRYLYSYRYPVVDNFNDTVIVSLKSKVLATDRSGYSSSSDNALTFIISSPQSLSTPTLVEDVPEEEEKEDVAKKGKQAPEKKMRKSRQEIEQEALQRLSMQLKKLTNPEPDIKKSTNQSDSVSRFSMPLGSRIKIIDE